VTDRVGAITVILEKDWRADDVQAVINALKMIRGVADAMPEVTSVTDAIARVRVRREMIDKIFGAINNNPEES
jgi:hypothetical protein